MGYISGVNLLPGTGEFTLDTIAWQGQRAIEPASSMINIYNQQNPFYTPITPASYTGTGKTDFVLSIDNLVAAQSSLTTVSIVVCWFFNSTDATACNIYPSTTYIGGAFYKWNGSSFSADTWKVSGLTQSTAGIIPISTNGISSNYGGTPSDPSVVRAIQNIKGRGLRVVFYPFLLGDIPGSFPWRGRIGYSGSDISSGAATAVSTFLGTAATGHFTRDTTNLTVSYVNGTLPSNGLYDWTYRRMILHYANLCVIAGGVDLFLIGSELVGLTKIRGPSWTPSGTGNPATWDYPFVNGLVTLAGDVRSVFDTAGLTKNTTTKKNLISYAADWSEWMGVQHG